MCSLFDAGYTKVVIAYMIVLNLQILAYKSLGILLAILVLMM